MPEAARVWVLADDRPGNANQALGVAEALGWPFEVKPIRYGRLADLPNLLLGASTLGLTGQSKATLVPPWPDLVIAAGRRTAPVARWLKRRNPHTFAVQMMWPGSARGLDLIAVPEHDEVPARSGVIRTLGAAHRLQRRSLLAAAEALEPRISLLPKPRVACLVGGTSRHAEFTPEDARRLVQEAGRLAEERGGSLLVSTSRRTGPACEQAIEQAGAPVPLWLYKFGAGGENPYLGLLGSADAVVVTADSASMCTEACAVGVPVFLFRPRAGTAAKLAQLQARLEALGHLRPLGAPWPERVPPPLYPQATVATAIRARLCDASNAREMASTPPTR